MSGSTPWLRCSPPSRPRYLLCFPGCYSPLEQSKQSQIHSIPTTKISAKQHARFRQKRPTFRNVPKTVFCITYTMQRQKNVFEKWISFHPKGCLHMFRSFWHSLPGNLSIHKDSSCLTEVNWKLLDSDGLINIAFMNRINFIIEVLEDRWIFSPSISPPNIFYSFYCISFLLSDSPARRQFH